MLFFIYLRAAGLVIAGQEMCIRDSFWGWGILGSLILVGPFIYTHKLLTAMNLLSADYNVNA